VKVFRGFAVAAAVLAFSIAVLGSWIRINGAGMTCPDWPLCNGALIPSLEGGVILEWSHRLIALVESFVVLGAIVTGWRVRREITGVSGTLAALGIVFFVQVGLGAATVRLSNSPPSVALHWGTGMALLATLTVLAVLSIVKPSPDVSRTLFRGDAATGTLAAAALVAFVTMGVGAYVSSSQAGLACPTVPTCDGTLFGTTASQFAQMLHRLFALACALLAYFAAAVAVATRAGVRVRGFAFAGCALVLAQIGLGIGNVLWRLPIDLREAHAANAAATFIMFTLAATLAALEPHRVRASAPERSARLRSTAPTA
jgi:cytochrome c oxidase assembly protein subunit 15